MAPGCAPTSNPFFLRGHFGGPFYPCAAANLQLSPRPCRTSLCVCLTSRWVAGTGPRSKLAARTTMAPASPPRAGNMLRARERLRRGRQFQRSSEPPKDLDRHRLPHREVRGAKRIFDLGSFNLDQREWHQRGLKMAWLAVRAMTYFAPDQSN